MPSSPTTLRYSEVVTVDLEENAINFADSEVNGHRVQVNMAKEDFNTYFKWFRLSNQDRPVGYINDIAGLQACLETSFSDGFTDLDSIATGLSYSTGSIFNPENVSGSINDVIMSYVLFKVYGQSSYNTANKVYNATDALNMVTNSDVSVSIGESITAHNARRGAIDQMFRDLLAADPARFFDAAGNQIPGLFETRNGPNVTGSWQITEDDIVQIILNFVFNAQVSRRAVSSQEQPLAGGGGLSGEEVTEEVIIPSGATFKIRLQVKATATQSARRIAQLAGGGGNPVVPVIVNNVVTGFSGSDLTDVVLPNTVTSIGISAFNGCAGLRSITIPNSVTSIDEQAFMYCTALTSITIPTSITRIPSNVFIGCTALTSVTIPSSVTSIGEYAFVGTGLTSITIPNSVTSIEEGAFAYSLALTSVTMPNNITHISWSTFEGCTGLTSITIPNGVTSIGLSAFSQCSSLASIVIPNSVTSIENSVFSLCSALTSYTFNSTNLTLGLAVFYLDSSISRTLTYPGPQNSTFETAAIDGGWTGTFIVTA